MTSTLKHHSELGSDLLRQMQSAEQQLQATADALRRGQHLEDDLTKAQQQYTDAIAAVHASESAWTSVRAARLNGRPTADQFIQIVFDSFEPISGLRGSPSDPAARCGVGKIGEHTVAFFGTAKGTTADEQLACNFGLLGPVGFRSYVRTIELAEKNQWPLLSFVDTPGAMPSIEAEEAGIAQSIAQAMLSAAGLSTPSIAIVTGEGGSGGALALAISDHTMILRNAFFSVISPEACASILYRDGSRAQESAERLGLTAEFLVEQRIMDELVDEPSVMAHVQPNEMLVRLRHMICAHLKRLASMDNSVRLDRRHTKYRSMGSTVPLESAA